MTEDEMVTPVNSEGQGGLVGCSPGGYKELDTTELLTHY